MVNLVTEVKPENLVNYGKLVVGFFDGFVNKKIDKEGNITIAKDAEPVLYVHIQIAEDKYCVTRRKASSQRNRRGERADETVLFKKAYDKYLAAKKGKPAFDPEKEIMRAKIAELEANQKVKIEPKKKVKIEPKTIETESKE